MSMLQVYVEGIGLFGSGLCGWSHAREVLAGKAPFELQPIKLPTITALPPAERRRIGLAIQLAIALGFDVIQHAKIAPDQLTAVFSSTGGDCEHCYILETLASPERAVSPTRFHNSVHNAPAGYWSIATASRTPSTSLCAYDATFAAGLLEAATQVVTRDKPCLLIAFDTAYPEPLYTLRPIPYPFGVSLILNSLRTEATQAALTLDLSHNPATSLLDNRLEALRLSIPAARSLPLLECLAQCKYTNLVIDYLSDLNLAIEVRA